MAIFHLQAKVIRRSAGRSALSAAAYRAGERLYDARLAEWADYAKKPGVEFSGILLPENAPRKFLDRATLWNAAEAAERRKDAQLAREIELALPVELGPEEQQQLLLAYVQRQFVDQGMIADVAIHRDNPENPHAHVLLTMREVGPDGFGPKNRTWNARALVVQWRAEWAEAINHQLALQGLDHRVSHLSHEARGLRLEPGKKIGSGHRELSRDKRDIIDDRLRLQREIQRRNGARMLADPTTALDAITHQQSTFTSRDVANFVRRHTADEAQYVACVKAVMASDDLVPLGEHVDGRLRYTTLEMLVTEQNLLKSAAALQARSGHQVKKSARTRGRARRGLSDEQLAAYQHLLESAGIAVVEGYAGTGKSHLLGAVREAYEGSGFRVRGAALSGKAAEGLEGASGIPSRSLASLEWAWKKASSHHHSAHFYQKDLLTSRDILVIDEAGMVGTRQLARVLREAQTARAKVILVGDTGQLQAIEAGAPMRAIGGLVGQVTLSDIRRHTDPNHKRATLAFGEGRVNEALQIYDQQGGAIVQHATDEQAMNAMVDAWFWMRNHEPEASQLLMAYRRVEVRALNEKVRERLGAEGALGPEVPVQTERGLREFAAGDRLYFLKNDRSLGVKNGTLGTVLKISAANNAGDRFLSVHLDDGREIRFSTEDYQQLDHGYAATVHKAQGVTVDYAQALASPLFDRHVVYVAMSRHRYDVKLHFSTQTFPGGRPQMERLLSRDRPKMLALDYMKVHGLDDDHLNDERSLNQVAPVLAPDWAEPLLDATIAQRVLRTRRQYEAALAVDRARCEARLVADQPSPVPQKTPLVERGRADDATPAPESAAELPRTFEEAKAVLEAAAELRVAKLQRPALSEEFLLAEALREPMRERAKAEARVRAARKCLEAFEKKGPVDTLLSGGKKARDELTAELEATERELARRQTALETERRRAMPSVEAQVKQRQRELETIERRLAKLCPAIERARQIEAEEKALQPELKIKGPSLGL